MEKYLVKSTAQEAKNRSADLFEGSPGDDTVYKFEVISNLETGQGALVIPAGYESDLTQDEQSELKTRQWMLDNGWSTPYA